MKKCVLCKSKRAIYHKTICRTCYMLRQAQGLDQ